MKHVRGLVPFSPSQTTLPVWRPTGHPFFDDVLCSPLQGTGGQAMIGIVLQQSEVA